MNADSNKVAEGQQMSQDFTALLKSLDGVSMEQLQEMMKGTSKLLKQRQDELTSQREQELAGELQPYEDNLKAKKDDYDAEIARIDNLIKDLREEKKTAATKYHTAVSEVLEVYNARRKELNLKPKTLRAGGSGSSGTTRIRTGEQHKYDLAWVDDSFKTINIIVDKDDNKKFTVDLKDGTPHVKAVSEALKAFGIDIRDGGMARGLVNRIRKEQLKVRQAEPAQP